VWSPSKAAALRIAKRRSVFYSGINVWPFVGVMITLLFMFMIQTKPFLYRRWPGDLPKALSARPQPLAVREDAMRISIMRDGRMFYLDEFTSAKDLPGLLLQSMREGAEKKVYLAVDMRSRYAETAIVLDQVRATGIENVCFITR
jgi:biopolymer transport protein ExbD